MPFVLISPVYNIGIGSDAKNFSGVKWGVKTLDEIWLNYYNNYATFGRKKAIWQGALNFNLIFARVVE